MPNSAPSLRVEVAALGGAQDLRARRDLYYTI